MNLYRKLEKIILDILNWLWVWFILIHEWKNILKKRNLYKDVKLTFEQKKQIDEFYKENYGKKVHYWWHRLYQSYTGEFDYRYIPEYIFSTKLEPRQNQRADVLPLENKNMLSVVFCGIKSNVRTPKTFVMCVKGRCFDAERNIISREKVVETLKNTNGGRYGAVIKLTVDTSSGRGVRILEIADGKDVIENESLENVLSQMGDNFVVQEKLIPHPAFATLYPKSINTLRVITYMVDETIKVAPIILRIGQGGGTVDNAHAGGMFIGVTDEGKLLKEAFTEYQTRYTVHPDTNIQFENYQLPCIPEIRQTAIRLHQQVPMLQFVSWDFTVDKEENIVLIEANLHSQSVWLSQIAHGKSIFGEDTGKMLQQARKR